MERLTIRNSDKHVDFISPIGTTFAASDLRSATIQVLLDRLAAYEDTGLSPDEVAAMVEKERREAVELAELCGGISGGYVEHIRELLRAEQDGWLVVLPCKVGDTVFVPDEENKATRDIEVSYYNVEDNSIVAVCTFDCTNYGCPCVFADWRWDGEESACSAYGCFVFEPKDIGKTVFLTREEAEAALAKEG